MIPFIRDFDARHGERVRHTGLIARVTAANPGPFTFTGTNTFIIGREEAGAGVAVIDPGPDDPRHLQALLRAVQGRQVAHILVTHTHRDHAPLAARLALATGAPVSAARPPGRIVHASGALDEGDDVDFSPDHILADGQVVVGDGWSLRTLSTPGHASNHLAFELIEENALVCGDHVMGWSTTVVAPPDGDMAAYMTSLDAVIARDFACLWPAHGAAIPRPRGFLEAYRRHRLDRDAQIMARLRAGDRRISEMVPTLYAAVDRRLWPAASLSVWAHLIAMVSDGRAAADPAPTLEADYVPG